MTEHPAPHGPLQGIRVLDLTEFVLGPYATQMLGDLGADVIKIESPAGDRQRRSGKAPRSATMGPVFVSLNRNKRSVALDLKTEPGKRALARLVRTADVLIHNMRPEAIERLGFGYAAVAALKPGIVYVACVGYGSGGPYAGRQAFDDLVQAASGTASLLPLMDGNPELRLIPSVIADKTCGLFAVIASLAALQHRARTGEGQYVEVPMFESFTGFMLAEHLYGHTYVPPTGRLGFSVIVSPERKPLATRDGFIVVLPASMEQAARFLALGGHPGFYESEAFVAAPGKEKLALYHRAMREAAASRTTEEWMALAAEHHIPLMRTNRLEDVADDPHLKAVGFFEERAIEGEGRYRAMRPALHFARTPLAIRRDPPAIGQHTDEILAELEGRAAPDA